MITFKEVKKSDEKTRIEMKIMKLIEKMPERVLFGSDYAGCSQKEHIHLVEKLGLKKEIEKRVYKENAERVYSLR